MLQVSFVGKFKKDYKLCQKRGYNITLLQTAIDILAIPQPLPQKNKDHSLTGNYAGYRECHILPDWLLIYQQTQDEFFLSCCLSRVQPSAGSRRLNHGKPTHYIGNHFHSPLQIFCSIYSSLSFNSSGISSHRLSYPCVSTFWTVHTPAPHG